jgi:hypothetical protein
MAYGFVSSSSQSLTMAAPAGIGFGEPLTMACWFYTPSAAVAQTLISIGPPDNENLGYLIRTGTTAKVLASKNNNTAPVTTLSLTANAWNHAAAVFVSNASRTVYLNNTSVFSGATVANATGTAFTSMSIGRRHVVGTTPQYCNGRITEVGIWTAALTAEEILSLSQGASPALVRPHSLAFYAPLIRDLQDLRGGLAITNNNGATVVDHPRIYY